MSPYISPYIRMRSVSDLSEQNCGFPPILHILASQETASISSLRSFGSRKLAQISLSFRIQGWRKIFDKNLAKMHLFGTIL